ncbi:MAG: hypothetical protein RR620_04240 [Clostridium sp.]
MINLIKSDLYRLFRSKTYKGCAIASLGVITFVLGISIFTDVELWIMSFTGQDEVRRGFLIGLENATYFNEFIINALGAGAALYIIAITLTSSVVISRRKSGIMKNTVAYGYERWKLYVSQVISLIVGITILVVITFLTILLITCIVFKPSDINYEGVLLVVKSLILYICVISSTVSIYVLLATLISNSEVISVIAMCEMLGLAMLGPFLPTAINNCIPYSMIRTVAQVPKNVNFVEYILNGSIIIIITSFIGILIFNKKEIK